MQFSSFCRNRPFLSRAVSTRLIAQSVAWASQCSECSLDSFRYLTSGILLLGCQPDPRRGAACAIFLSRKCASLDQWVHPCNEASSSSMLSFICALLGCLMGAGLGGIARRVAVTLSHACQSFDWFCSERIADPRVQLGLIMSKTQGSGTGSQWYFASAGISSSWP